MKGRIIIIIILFLVALALFGAAFVYYYQGEYLPLYNKVLTLPLVEQPASTVIGNMLDNIKTVSTASYDLDAQSSWNAYGSPFELDTKILFDGRFEDKPKGKVNINNDIKIQNLTFLTSVDASLSDEKIYFQVDEIPALPFLDLQKIQNKWYEIDWGIINFGNFNIIYDSMKNFMTLKERLPDEVINGYLSYHYVIGMKSEFFNDFYNLLPEQGPYKDLFNQENFNKIVLNVWISKESNYLIKAEGNFLNDFIDLKISLDVTNYNQPISIEKPEKGATLNSMTKDLFGQTNILDVTVFSYLAGINDTYLTDDKDGDKLYMVWEDLFGTDDNKVDSDDDGFNDLDEIKNGYNPNGQGKLLD